MSQKLLEPGIRAVEMSTVSCQGWNLFVPITNPQGRKLTQHGPDGHLTPVSCGHKVTVYKHGSQEPLL